MRFAAAAAQWPRRRAQRCWQDRIRTCEIAARSGRPAGERPEGRQGRAGRQCHSRHAAFGLHDPRRALVPSCAPGIPGHSPTYQRGFQRRCPRMAGRRTARYRRIVQFRAGAQSARPTVALADALKMPLILPGRPHGLRILVDSVCAEAGFTPDVVLELDSMAAVKDLVRRADAATILPFCGVYRDVEQGHFVARRIVSPSITRTLIVAETVRRPKTPATTAVVRCLREEVARLVAAGIWTGRDQDNDLVIADRSI